MESVNKEMDNVFVYTAKIPTDLTVKTVYPPQKNLEISSCLSQKVKEEKFFAWCVLEFAIKNTFGFDLKTLNFSKQENGKWICDKCHFSISHSHGVVAVAVSNIPVGVDLELFEPAKSGCIEKYLTLSELNHLEQLSSDKKWEFLLAVWSKKESVYKKQGLGAFIPSKIDTVKENVETQKVIIGERAYLFSLCCDKGATINSYHDINII